MTTIAQIAFFAVAFAVGFYLHRKLHRLYKERDEARERVAAGYEVLLEHYHREREKAERLMTSLRDLKQFAEGHHGDQEPHIFLHALTVDIPAMIDATLERTEWAMNDPFQNYDRWKRRTPEDEEEAREQQRLRGERLADKAEHDADLKQSKER